MKLAPITPAIIEIKSDKLGPTLAIFAGAHGNELAGVYALQELVPKLEITKGRLLLAFANPPAIEANSRSINKNLNRCYFADNSGSDPEDIRARELMAVLDQADALLDMHMFHDDNGQPFAICEDDALDLASKFDVNIISTNWDTIEPGASDWYMYRQGKRGVCLECGPISKGREYTGFATRSIYQFLAYFDMTNETVKFSTKSKRIITAQYVVHKQSDFFKLASDLHNFDLLKPGQLIASEGSKKYIAKEGECILFPRYNAKLGEEAFILASENTD
jgi:succinylglutamate desuccinylase